MVNLIKYVLQIITKSTHKLAEESKRFVNKFKTYIGIALKNICWHINGLRSIIWVLIARMTEHFFLNYIFTLYKYASDSLFTITILVLTWLIIQKTTTQIIVDFRVEFLGIVYTILIIDLSIYMRSSTKNIKIKDMFVNALKNYTDIISYHIAHEYKINVQSDQQYDFDALFNHIYCPHDTEQFSKNLMSISNLLDFIETQSAHILELYEAIINIDLKVNMMEIMLKTNNNNLYKIHKIDILLKENNSENLNNICYRLTRVYIGKMTDDDRIQLLLSTILKLNIRLLYDLIDDLNNLEKNIRKYYNPMFTCTRLNEIKDLLAPHLSQ